MPRKKTIAVVEDEAAIQQVLLEWLDTEGYNAYALTTGPEAIELIPKKLPDLILLDIILPEKNGFEVMKELKQNPATADIPIIILTNLGNGEERELAQRLGAKAYIVKAENDFEGMKKIVDSILKNSKNHKMDRLRNFRRAY